MNYRSKMLVCEKKKSLKGSAFFINEDLTFTNMKLLNYGRKEATGVVSIWCTDGKVLARDRDNHIFRNRSIDEFLKFNLF